MEVLQLLQEQQPPLKSLQLVVAVLVVEGRVTRVITVAVEELAVYKQIYLVLVLHLNA
jgi:hypothetical protein